jgi:hypothetical protein
MIQIYKGIEYKNMQHLLDVVYKDKPIVLLTAGQANSKTSKSEEVFEDFTVMIQHLLPHHYADLLMQRGTLRTVCPFATAGHCFEACLNLSGRAKIFRKKDTTNAIQLARLRRTLLYLNNREEYMTKLFKEIDLFVKRCIKNKKKPALRLNGTSDIQWETIKHEGVTVFEKFPQVQFYDYTKIPTRKISHISNYHLTWSYSEANQKYANYFDKLKYNIAVVFSSKTLPPMFKGLRVIDGDKTDMRFLDGNKRVVVGLKAKGKAKTDTSGFVIHNLNRRTA